MSGCAPEQSGVIAIARRIASEFDLPPDHLRRVTNHFIKQMKDGLQNHRAWQLPAYVRKVPTGTEKGRFLAVDLGGSNCRICLVELHGDSTFNVIQSKHTVPATVMVNQSYRPLFSFIAEKISDFFRTHLNSNRKGRARQDGHDSVYKLGFTFSFTCEQTSLARGTLIHWDKGWDIPEALGRDPCAMLQEAIDKLKLPIFVSVLANDSVGTLLARSYTSGQTGATLAAVIFGTGTNAAYVEKLSNIRRLETKGAAGDVMVVNTEWGCFDDKMEVLPRTEYDDDLDANSTHPGTQMVEKRMSGMYLGELLRLIIIQIAKLGAFRFKLDNASRVFQRGSIDSSFLSKLADHSSETFDMAEGLIAKTLSAEDVGFDDVQAVRILAAAIAERAARLAGAALAAVIIHSRRLETPGLFPKSQEVGVNEQSSPDTPQPSKGGIMCLRFKVGKLLKKGLTFFGLGFLTSPPQPASALFVEPDGFDTENRNIIDIGADGSLIEFYPTFEENMRKAMREIPEMSLAGESRIRIGLAKDGSGVGAALMAQAASEEEIL